MESKINGCVYHRFINNYQKPLLATKIESINTPKRTINKRNTVDTFKSKIIYVNKKAGNIPLNQIDISSETKSITNTSERTLSSLRNANKSDNISCNIAAQATGSNGQGSINVAKHALNIQTIVKKKYNSFASLFSPNALFPHIIASKLLPNNNNEKQ